MGQPGGAGAAPRPGEFEMGSPKDGPAAEDARIWERPAHAVRFSQGIQNRKDEVTFDEYERCTNAGVCPGAGSRREPVTMVSWKDARLYTQWLSKATGTSYRLPTEAESEIGAGRDDDPLLVGKTSTRSCELQRVRNQTRRKRPSGWNETGSQCRCGGSLPREPLGPPRHGGKRLRVGAGLLRQLRPDPEGRQRQRTR